MQHTVEYTLPLYVEIGKRKKKRISLTLNWYRNAHFQVSNQVKQAFNPIGEPFKAEAIYIEYRFILADNRRTDAMNWIATADKFFVDWLVNQGMIPDDNADHYQGGNWQVTRDTSLKEHRLTATVHIFENKLNAIDIGGQDA